MAWDSVEGAMTFDSLRRVSSDDAEGRLDPEALVSASVSRDSSS